MEMKLPLFVCLYYSGAHAAAELAHAKLVATTRSKFLTDAATPFSTRPGFEPGPRRGEILDIWSDHIGAYTDLSTSNPVITCILYLNRLVRTQGGLKEGAVPIRPQAILIYQPPSSVGLQQRRQSCQLTGIITKYRKILQLSAEVSMD